MTRAQETILLQILNTQALLCLAISALDELCDVRQLLVEQSQLCQKMATTHFEYMKKDLE